MRWRLKTVRRFGGATVCAINIASYDPAQSGFFRRVDTSISAVWKLPAYLGGTTVKECSASLYSSVDGVVPHCESDSGGSFECDPPAACDGLPCQYEETTTYSGSGPVTGSTAEGEARSRQTTVDEGWTAWAQGYPNLSLLSTALSNMTRSDTSCSFTERTVTIQLAGAFRPFMIRTREAVTSGGSTTTETVDREIIAPTTEIVLDWTAVANVSRVLSSAHILLPQ